MFAFEMTTEIMAPVGQVFSFLNDPKRYHEWVPGIVNVEVVPGKVGRTGRSGR